MSLSTKKVNKVSSVELIQIERRISIPQLQVRGALSGGEGGMLMLPLTGRKATAFMSKQRKRIANVRFTGCKDVTESHLFTYRQEVA